MRIVFVVHTFFPHWQAGTEVYARSLARKAILHGHEVFLVCYEPPPPDSEYFDGVKAWDSSYEGLPVHRVSFFKTYRSFHVKEFFDPTIEEHLHHYFSELHPDIVHIVHAMHLSTASIWAAKRLGLPVVATATDFWYICPTYQLVKHDESLCRGPAPASCLACITHAPMGSRLDRMGKNRVISCLLAPALVLAAKLGVLRGYGPAMLIWLSSRPLWMKKTLAQVDVLLVPTPNTARLLSENGITAPSVQTCGFGLESHPSPPKERQPGPVLRLAYIGTFRHSKGVHVLLEAMRLLPADRVRLDIYGKTGHFPEYDRYLFQLAEGLENVTFRGTFPNEELPDIFGGFDVLVIPALWYENSPLVLLSSFAQKVPVIASRVGSLADLIEHGKNGLLFDMGQPASLAQQVRRIIDNPATVSRLRAGIPPVKTVDENVAELFKIYDQLHANREAARVLAPPQPPRYLSRLALTSGSLAKRMMLAHFGAQFGSHVALLDCRIVATADHKLHFEFKWHAREIAAEWVVFVHLTDKHRRIRLQADHPLCRYNQDPWGFFAYSIALDVPPDHFGNTYEVKVGLWQPGAAARLPVLRAKGLKIDPAECSISMGSIELP